ncbi:transposase [Streptomyces sp. NPDC003863]
MARACRRGGPAAVRQRERVGDRPRAAGRGRRGGAERRRRARWARSGSSRGRRVGARCPSGFEPPTVEGWPRRQLIDGMRFQVRTGVPWRDVPVEYGPWGRIYDLFRRWQRNGTWHRGLGRLRSLADAKGAISRELSVDPTVCRAHQHAAGVRKRG